MKWGSQCEKNGIHFTGIRTLRRTSGSAGSLLRPKEQKKQIKRDVAEINNAYKAYNAELKSTIAEIGEYEYKEKMRKELAKDNTKLLSQTARILEVRKKYKIHCDEGHLSMNICHIAYSFDDKRLELGEDE